MKSAEVSDLEEGEILEYDSLSSNYPKDNMGVRHYPFESAVRENRIGHFRFSDSKDWYLPEQWKDGYINVRLKEKLNLKEKPRDNNKSVIRMADLESISSEGEYKSDEDVEYSADESEYYACSTGEAKKREKQHSAHFYGTVEDIMSEIGETICRKSRCNYKKRKSKDPNQSLEKCSNNSYDVWRREIFSSHVKSRKHKRKGSACESESDLGKHREEKRKKRKKREVYYGEEEAVSKKLKLRDSFDEMRRKLLEKLKKQKAEEEMAKEAISETPLELENSEIQEIDMLVDCTNYVDDPPDAIPDYSANEGRREEEKDGEDELDLIQLRLIALASNKKRKVEEEEGEEEKLRELSADRQLNGKQEDIDLDRNELLLRAEALKTALLKKHQRRLNRLKVGKSASEADNSSIKDSAAEDSSIPAAEKEPTNTEGEKERLTGDACKENVESQAGGCSNPPGDAHLGVENNETISAALPTNGNPKKTLSRAKGKRKKRKSASLANNLKENNEKSEVLEEDDNTLRNQLLSDLMKKKSLKNVEKKCVLTDSVQTAGNKPAPSPSPSPSVINAEPPKGNTKPLTGVKKNLLTKVNVPKTVKSKASVVPKFPKPEIQRIIVHLGSEDSSDEEGAQKNPPQEKAEKNEGAVTEFSNANAQSGEVIQARYERSVEQLLSEARKKIEGEKRKAAKTLATPEAVYKHLPPSQRLEYMRLKQKIAERERLKKQKEKSGVASSVKQTVQVPAASKQESVPQKPESGNDSKPSDSFIGSPQKNGSGASRLEMARRNSSTGSNNPGGPPTLNGVKKKEADRRLVVKQSKENSTGKSLSARGPPPESGPKSAASTEMNSLLLPSSQALISKLKLLLKKIKLEKMIEENYEKEISKLKNQLSLFEKKKCEQRFKIKKIWEESMKTYKAIQGITGKPREKAAPKESEGATEKKEEGDVRPGVEEGKTPREEREEEDKEEKEREETKQADEEEGKKVSHEPETEISKAESASDKELKNDGEISESVAGGVSCGPYVFKYDSPLQAFNKVSDRSTRIDPNVMVCQFDLMGVCRDEECTYQHLSIVAK